MKVNRKKVGFALGVAAIAGVGTVAVLSVPALMAPIAVPAFFVYAFGAGVVFNTAGNIMAAIQRCKAPTGPGPQGKPPGGPVP